MKKTLIAITLTTAAVIAAVPTFNALAQEPLPEIEFSYAPGDILPVEFGETNWQDYAYYGLDAAAPGTEWVRVDDDAMLIQPESGEIIYVAHDLDARRTSS